MHAFQLLLGALQRLGKAAVEFAQHVLPGRLPLFNGVERLFHAGGELRVHDVGEFILHQPGDDLAQRRRAQIFALLEHILAVQDRRDRGSVGGRAADAVLLHRADQRRVCIAQRRLSEVLLLGKALQHHGLALLQLRQLEDLLLLVLVVRLLIDGRVAGELQAAGAGMELVAVRLDLHADAVVDGVCHLAGQETAPDQAVEAVLLTGEVALDLLGRQVHVGGTDGLVRVLCTLFCLEAACGRGIILLSVAAEDKALRVGERLLGKAQRIGTHIGDQTHGALAGDVHALIELLGNRHGAPRRHVQLARGVLLQRGGGKRRRGRALLIRALDAADGKRRILRLLHDRVHRLAGGRLDFLAVPAVIVRDEGLPAAVIQQLRVDRPVLLRHEGADFAFAVDHHAHCRRLHATGGESAAHLFPQQRRELVAHDAVENTARLLRVHQILINGAGREDAFADHLFGDLVEGHALGLFIAQAQQCLEMPGDRLALAVRVRCKIDHVAGLGGFFQFVDQRFLALDRLVIGLEVMLDIYADLALGQIAQMPHAGRDDKVLAQIFANGLGLCRGFHNDQVLFCHVDYSSNNSALSEKCLPPLWMTCPSISSTVSAESTRRVGSSTASIRSSTCCGPFFKYFKMRI